MSSNEGKYLVKSVPMEVIKLKSRLDSQKLYDEVPELVPPPATTGADTGKSGQFCRNDGNKNSSVASNSGTVATANREDTAVQLTSYVLAFLRIWLSLSHPFFTAGDLLERANITSGSARDALLKALLRFKLVIVHKVQKDRTRLQIWEPTDKAYQALQLPKPQFHSKGGFLHQFIAHHVVEAAKLMGYVAKREFFTASGKAVDVALFKADTVIAIEIAISPPLSKELDNIVADFASEPELVKLIFVTTDAKARKELEALINADARTHVYMDRIQLTLAGCFLNTNPELSDVIF